MNRRSKSACLTPTKTFARVLVHATVGLPKHGPIEVTGYWKHSTAPHRNTLLKNRHACCHSPLTSCGPLAQRYSPRDTKECLLARKSKLNGDTHCRNRYLTTTTRTAKSQATVTGMTKSGAMRVELPPSKSNPSISTSGETPAVVPKATTAQRVPVADKPCKFMTRIFADCSY